MSQNKKFTYVLTEFCEKHGLASVSQEADKVYEFYIEGTDVQCYQKGEDLVLHSSLGSLPEDTLTAQSVLKNLLQLSLLNSEVSGFVLSLDEFNVLKLSHRRTLNHCLLTDLEEAIEELLGHAEQYAEQIQSMKHHSQNIYPSADIQF